ncbi:MAG: hypothetical protein SVV03_00630, partial [Candidatus Nanohaloarchaea archaeon]|nr:hypothetical protein [Candidatus Nanohaloarchaea archaeon]
MELSIEKKEEIRKYYLRDDIVEEMVRISQYREFAPTYPRGYGKRPDSVNYEKDFRSYVENGAVAFHGSVELWSNPLLLEKVDQDKLRKGWDLVIDIDADRDLVYAKEAAIRLIEELKRHGIEEENISVKFSGNRGFHIGMRSQMFPDKIGGKETASQYPELPQAIVKYLRSRIEDDLSEKFVDIEPELEEEIEDEGPFEIADVENDWGKRHLFRLPYSVNEKSWLVSKPIEIGEIRGFKKADAKMEEIDEIKKFMDSYEEGQAADLAVQALDWISQRDKEEESGKKTKEEDYDIPENSLSKEYFPPPIKKLLKGLEDGRKRALFILATFMRHVGYSWDAVEKEIWDWNDRNKEPLRDNYIKSQLQWHRNQEDVRMPPNFGSKGWYKDLGVIDEEEDRKMLENFDNPVP